MGKHFKIGQLYDETFEKLTTDEIEDNLESICYGISEEEYTRNLTEEELADKKHQLAEVAIKLAALEEEKKELMDEIKDRFKEPVASHKDLLEVIKHRSERKEGKLYKVDDQENGMMYFFDNTGQCVHARSINPSEKQTVLRKLKQVENE